MIYCKHPMQISENYQDGLGRGLPMYCELMLPPFHAPYIYMYIYTTIQHRFKWSTHAMYPDLRSCQVRPPYL